MAASSGRTPDALRPLVTEPLKRQRVQPGRFPELWRRGIHVLLVFATFVLVVDALVGEKGLIDTMQARRQYREVAGSLEALRRDNSRLRENVRLLKEDPATIEALARKELGLIRPGEMVFIIKEASPAR